MYHHSLFEILRQTGERLLDLVVEMQSSEELFASPNTLAVIEQLLLQMAQTLGHLPPALHLRLPQVDWAGWAAVHQSLAGGREPGPGQDEVWYAVCALVPATLVLLDRLRQREPQLFEIIC
jgi:uncharacterized protein with HEPN domain